MSLKITWLDVNASFSHASLALPAIEAQWIHQSREWSSVQAVPQWEQVRGTIRSDPHQLMVEVLETAPDVVCATLWLFNHAFVLEILSNIKKLLPHCVIALGGPEFCGDNAEFLRDHPYVDLVFRGEGEDVFYDWLRTCSYGASGWRWNREAWKEIAGLCYLLRGNYYDGGRARVKDFGGLVPPEQSRFFPWNRPFVQLETTRGCFNTCQFCVSGGDQPVRSLSTDQIQKRLEEMYKKGVRNVRLLDRTFNGSKERALSLLRIFEQGYPGMCFHLEIHPAFLPKELRDQLAKMSPGKLHLEAGLQSLQENVIRATQRKGTCAQAMDGIRFLKNQPQFQTHTDLIGGLPYYTYMDTLDDVRQLIEVGVTEIQLENLKVLPGTPFRENARQYGLVYSDFPPYEVLQSNAITRGELNQLSRLSRFLDDYYNAHPWREVIRALSGVDETFLERFPDTVCLGMPEAHACSPERKGEYLYAYCRDQLPEQLPLVALYWVLNGFSLRKKPAELLKKHFGDDVSTHYYLLDDPYRSCRYLFEFDTRKQGSKPLLVRTEAYP